MEFSHTCLPVCPHCTANDGSAVLLDCTQRNFGGYGVDVGDCPECGKRFYVSYEVLNVEEIQ